MGIAVSISLTAMFAVFLVVQTLNFIGNGDPFFAMMNMPSDPKEDIDLVEHGFFFTVSSLDLRAGRVVAEHQSKDFTGRLES